MEMPPGLEQPKTPVLQPRKIKDTALDEDLKRQQSEDQEILVANNVGQKKKRIIKLENQEEDNIPAMKTSTQRKDNLNHAMEQRMKTELPKVDANGNRRTASIIPTMEFMKEQLTNISTKNIPTTTGSTTPSHSPKMGNGFPNKVSDIPSSPQEKGVCGDLLSILSSPSGVPDMTGLTTEMLQGYTMAIVTVKNALISFLTTASPNDVALMVTQANSAFSSLKGLKADYQSFYHSVRSYIVHCSELCTAEKELEENMQSVRSISRHEKLVHQSSEATRVVSNIEADLIKAKNDLAPLEARVQDTRELLEKLELELGERKTDVENLEAEKTRKMEAIAAVDAKIQAVERQAEEAQIILKDILSRREAARAAMEESRAQLTAS